MASHFHGGSGLFKPFVWAAQAWLVRADPHMDIELLEFSTGILEEFLYESLYFIVRIVDERQYQTVLIDEGYVQFVHAFSNLLGYHFYLVFVVLKACFAKVADSDADKAELAVPLAAVSFHLQNLGIRIPYIEHNILHGGGKVILHLHIIQYPVAEIPCHIHHSGLPGYGEKRQVLPVAKIDDILPYFPGVGTQIDNKGAGIDLLEFPGKIQKPVFTFVQNAHGKDQLVAMEKRDDTVVFDDMNPLNEVVETIMAGNEFHVVKKIAVLVQFLHRYSHICSPAYPRYLRLCLETLYTSNHSICTQ